MQHKTATGYILCFMSESADDIQFDTKICYFFLLLSISHNFPVSFPVVSYRTQRCRQRLLTKFVINPWTQTKNHRHNMERVVCHLRRRWMRKISLWVYVNLRTNWTHFQLLMSVVDAQKLVDKAGVSKRILTLSHVVLGPKIVFHFIPLFFYWRLGSSYNFP